jgi:hypothetical protein
LRRELCSCAAALLGHCGYDNHCGLYFSAAPRLKACLVPRRLVIAIAPCP